MTHIIAVAGDVENVVTPESSDTKTAKSVVVKSVVQQEFDRDAGDKIIRRLAKEASDKYERLHNLDVRIRLILILTDFRV